SPVGGGRRVVVLPLGGGAVAGAVDREEAAEHGRLAATNMGRRSGGRSGDDCATTSVSTDDADSVCRNIVQLGLMISCSKFGTSLRC
ncbi:unnamed protein product, partial [Urochloa humidicola]